MARRLLPTGLRGRLVAAIVVVTAIVLAGSFFALHRTTGADLNRQIDDQLQGDASEFAASPAVDAKTEGQLRRRARAFLAGQGYHADSRVFAIQVGSSPRDVVTNQPEAVVPEDEEGDESETVDGEDAAGGLLSTRPGLSTTDAPDGGRLRVLTEPIGPPAAPIGTFRVAQSLEPIGDSQSSLRSSLLIVGIVALAVLIAAALWIATVVARPLTRIAAFAAEIDTADLDRRLSEDDGPIEVRSLAHSFNRMLDRLQSAFDREREFVADASHELRTPVTIAQGELDLLRRSATEAEGERLEVVRRELKRMERLVAEMLTLASQDAEASLRHERVDLSDLLSDLRRDLPLMGSRHYVVDDLGGTVEADPDRLAQVFRNLLSNAVAHTDDGGEITVRATPVGDHVRFEVTDDGPGFGPDEAERLFDRFYRSGTGRARDGGGSGLGLTIARSIVEAHGGSIRVVPSDGASGGRIVFELPRYRA